MAAINAVIVPAKVLKGGRHKIRISIAHNGETRYLPTDIVIDSDKEFKHGSVVKRPDASYLNTKLRGILQRIQKRLDEIEYTNGFSCSELVFLLRNGAVEKKWTLQMTFEEWMANTNHKPSTHSNNLCMWKTITRHLDPTILLECINHGTILSLQKKLSLNNYTPTSMRTYLNLVFAVLNYAKNCGYVQYKVDPCKHNKLPPVVPRETWITVEDVKAIRDYIPTKKNLQLCKDFFMLSYYLGGINFVDLVKINFKECRHTLKYVRQKTETLHKYNKYVEFEIPDEARSILDRILDKDGYISLSDFKRQTLCSHFFKYNMPLLAKSIGLEKDLVYYSARKSFAQHAFDLGISESVIDFILGHKLGKGGTSLYSYISVTPEMATKAVRLVLDNLK